MSSLKSITQGRIFQNSAMAFRRNSFLLYFMLVIGFMWPVVSLELPGYLTLAKSLVQRISNSESRALKEGKQNPGEGGKETEPNPKPTSEGSKESKPTDDTTPKAPANPESSSSAEPPVLPNSTDPPTASPVLSKPTDVPTISPVKADPTDSPTVTNEESKPTDPPTISPVKSKPTGPPTVSPMKSEPTNPPTVTPVKSKATDSPTISPVKLKPTNPPTVSPVKSKPTDPPTISPVKLKPTDSPTVSPVQSKPTDPPTQTPLDDGGACSPAKMCTECRDLAASLASEDGLVKTCVWKDGACQIADKSKENASPIQCENDPPLPSADDDSMLNRPGQAMFGVLVVLVFVCILARRYLKRSTVARVNNTMNYGKYQGINTVSEDEDEEWGWGDDKPNHRSGLEMKHMRSGNRSMSGGSVGSSPRQRRSVSPQMGNTAAPVERKGFAVRKKGMNNPLHQPVSTQKPYAASSPSIVPKATPAVVPPLARKIVPPTTDDFFAEMGVASKPKFPPTTAAVKPPSSTKRLHATVLRLESDDALETTGGDNWGDDADLDDLLDS